MTEQANAGDVPADGVRRSTNDEVSAAIDLGWRVAALYSLRPRTLEPPAPVADDLLLNRRSLPASDRLELELRAIAGVAADAGVAVEDAELQGLLALAGPAAASVAGEDALRRGLAGLHVSFAKRLWGSDEPRGKAYELGNFISDTWNRLLWPRTKPDASGELREVFAAVRVERMKLLLDDLQARVDPVAVHAVTNHLDAWRDRVGAEREVEREPGPGTQAGATAGLTPAQAAAPFEPVERQTIIWRQLLTGDKEPEAFINHTRRAEVRDELTKQLWKRYRRPLPWLLPLVVLLGIGVGALYSHHRDDAGRVLGLALTLAGAFGITRATMIGTVRRGLQGWGDLMWNRALAAVICRETSLLHELYPPVVTRAQRVKRRLLWN
jgi:hypothetical protein